MKKDFFALLIFCTLAISALAQFPVDPQRNTNSPAVFTNLNNVIGKTVVDNVVYYKSDMTGLVDGIPLYRVTGSRFWNDQWQVASLYDNNNKILARIPVRLNLNFSSIHYLDKSGEELFLDPEIIKKVIFYTDTIHFIPAATFISFVPYIYFGKEKLNDYLQVMNQGTASLLKYQRKLIYSTDSAFGTQKSYSFKSESYYYLWFKIKAEPLKRLSKDALFELLPRARSFEKWVIENKLNLKKEEDVITFLNYYNSQIQE